MPEGTEFHYTGGVIDGGTAAAPPDGAVTLDAGGTAFLDLKGGQSVTLRGVPSESKIRIVETETGNYTVSFTDSAELLHTRGNDTGLRITGTAARRFDFVNTHVQVVTSGGAQNNAGEVLLMLIVPALLVYFAVWLTRRRTWEK